MLTVRHASESLYGAYRLARLDTGGLRYFDDSIDGFWRSFYAAALVLPIYFPVVVLRWAGDETPAPVFRFLAIESIAYVIAWVAFPLIMFYVCVPLKRERHFRRYIVAYNWTAVLQNAVYLPVVGLAFAGGMPDGGVRLFSDLMLVVILVWSGYVAARALDIPALPAFGIVVLDFVVGLVIHGYSDVMLDAV